MNFLTDWASNIAEAGGALASKIGLVTDLARVQHQSAERQVFGKKATEGLKRVAGPATHVVGQGLSGMDYLWREGVSEPISTVGQAAFLARRETVQAGEEAGSMGEWRRFFDGDTWSQAYGRAQTTSIGQSATEGLMTSTLAMPGSLADKTARKYDIQNRFAPTDAELARVRAGSTAYNMSSGGMDFAAHWYLDPMNIAGKALGAARIKYVKGALKPGTDIAAAVEGTGRAAKRVRSIVAMPKAWDTHQVYLGVEGLKESSNGMVLASALSKANKIEDPLEREAQLKLVNRIMLGDQSAKVELGKRNAEIMDQIAGAEKTTNDLIQASKWEDLGNGRQRYWNKPEVQAVYAERIKNAKLDEAKLQAEVDRLDQLGATFGTVRDRTLRVTGATTSRATRRGVSHFGLAARELEGPLFQKTTLRNSLWNVPVKIVAAPLIATRAGVRAASSMADALVTMAPQGYVHLHDPASGGTVDAMLRSQKDFPDELRSELVSKYLNATEEGAKVAAINQAEAHLFGHIAKKYGMDREDAAKLVNQYQMARMGWRDRTKMYAGIGNEQSYSAAPGTNGLTADSYIDEHGIVNRVPLLSTHLANSVPVLNGQLVEHVMKRNVNKLQALKGWGERAETAFGRTVAGSAGKADALRWGADELVHDGLNLFNRLWKFSVLFRLGYPIRNVTDEQLRIWAKLDSGVGQLYSEAAWNTTRNIGNRLTWADTRLGRAAKRIDEDRLAQLDEAIALGGDDVAELTPLRDEIQGRLDLVKKQGPAKVYGGARYRIGEKDILLPNGQSIKGAFGGDDAELRRALASGNGIAERLIYQGENTSYARATMGGDWRDIEPHEPGHTEVWLDAMNKQIRNDPVAKMVLAGKSDREIVQWLKLSKEGKTLSKRIPYHAANRDDWVANIRSHVESYVPKQEWREALLHRDLTAKDLAQFQGAAPRVNGPSLEHALGNGAVSNLVNRAMQTSMKYLSEIPADKLSRHPMYAALYQQRAMQEADLLLKDPGRVQLGKRVDALDEDDLAHLYKVSHEYALKEMKGTLYDISAHSNAAQMMRFMSPFMGAWQETLTRWWGLAKDKPQLINYFNLAWNAPNKAGLVVDREGNPVDNSESISDDEFLVMRLPKWAGGKDLKLFDSVPYIPKSAFNLALQGDPWWLPGFGPLVQIPVGAFQAQVPRSEDIAKFVNPFGPPKDVWDAVSPATVKRLRSYLDGNAARDFGQDNYRIFNQMKIEWEQGGEQGPPPTWGEAQDRTKALYKLKVANNFLNPFPANFRSPYQFYIDSYHILQEQARTEGKSYDWVDEEFTRKYGDTYFVLAQSMSKNNAGAQSTVEWVEAYQKKADVVADYPEFAAQIVGDHPGEFSQTAHAYAVGREFAPGSDTAMRDYKNPAEAQADNESKLGWMQYKKLMNLLDAVAADAGLESYQDNDGLKAVRKQYIEKLAQSNPAWFDKYTTFKSDKNFDGQMTKLEKLSQDKRLLADPSNTGVRTLGKYLELRKTFSEILAGQEHTTMAADSNKPLRDLYIKYVNRLVESDTQFSNDWYHGKLEFDPMLEAD